MFTFLWIASKHEIHKTLNPSKLNTNMVGIWLLIYFVRSRSLQVVQNSSNSLDKE